MHAAEELAARDPGCGVQDTALADQNSVAGLTPEESREERGKAWMASLAWQGAAGIISVAGPWIISCPTLLGGGTACWWERALVPEASSPVARSNPFSICPFIYYLPLSLALFFISWFPLLLALERAVLWGAQGQQQILFVLLLCQLSLLHRWDCVARTVN